MVDDKKIRCGALGCGRVFSQSHIHAYLDLPGVELIGIYDIDVEQAERAKALFERLLEERIAAFQNNAYSGTSIEGALTINSAKQYEERKGKLRIYSSAEELMNDVDVIDICAPVKFHAPYAKMALELGVNVMSEKPPARNWLEMKDLAEIADKSEALYQLNDDNVFLPRYQMIRHIIESGDIGEVVSVWVARGGHGPQEKAWFWNPEFSGGGSLMDYGTHAITATWYLVGMDKIPYMVKSFRVSKKHAQRVIAGRLREIDIDDDAHFKVCFQHPQTHDWHTVVIEATYSWPELGKLGSDTQGYIEVCGSEGSILGYIDEEGQSCLRVSKISYGDRVYVVRPTKREKDAFVAAVQNFIECVRAGKASILNEKVGSEVSATLGAVYLSELKGRIPVTLDEYKRFCIQEFEKTNDVDKATSDLVGRLTHAFRAKD